MKLATVAKQLLEFAQDAVNKSPVFKWVRILCDEEYFGNVLSRADEITYDELFELMNPDELMDAMEINRSDHRDKQICERFRKTERVQKKHKRAL